MTKSPMNLVIQTAFPGDLVLSIALLRQIRKNHHKAPIGLVCRKGLGELFKRLGVVDHVFEIQKGDRATYAAAVEAINAFDVQHLYCPHGSIRTGLFVRQIQARHKTGYRQWWNLFLFDTRIRKNPRLPEPLRQMQLLAREDETLRRQLAEEVREDDLYEKELDGHLPAVPSWAAIGMKNSLRKDTATWAALVAKFPKLESPGRKKIAVFPGSVWFTKRWMEIGFREFCQALGDDHQVILMGAGNERELCERVGGDLKNILILAGECSLFESLRILTECDLVLSNDSASAHLAAVAETPTVSIFGPTVLTQGFRPWSNKAWVIEMEDLICRPCGPHGHNKCPLGHHKCMRDIPSARVIEVAESVLHPQKR